MHPVAGLAELAREGAHGGEDGQDLLGVVEDVVGLLADLHQHVDHVRAGFGKPAVQRVELVAEDQAQGGHGALQRVW